MYPSGNAYVTGFTQSFDFPTTAGSFQATSPTTTCIVNGKINNCTHAFVTKLNPAGTGLIYSTYLGGSGPDSAMGIALDASGNA